MFIMMNDQFHCKTNCIVNSLAFVSSFRTTIWHISFFFTARCTRA